MLVAQKGNEEMRSKNQIQSEKDNHPSEGWPFFSSPVKNLDLTKSGDT